MRGEIGVTRKTKAIALVKSWLDDTSGYDKKVWPKLSREIDRHRLSHRKRIKSGK